LYLYLRHSHPFSADLCRISSKINRLAQEGETFPATNCHTLGSGLWPSWENHRRRRLGWEKLGWDGKAMAKSRAAIPCGILVAIAKQFMQCLLAEHELQH